HRMTVYDARPEATSELERLGVTRAADLPSLARAVRMTLLSLPNERVVEAVVLGAPGAPGLLAGAQPGDLVFDLSTVSPDRAPPWPTSSARARAGASSSSASAPRSPPATTRPASSSTWRSRT